MIKHTQNSESKQGVLKIKHVIISFMLVSKELTQGVMVAFILADTITFGCELHIRSSFRKSIHLLKEKLPLLKAVGHWQSI